MELALDVPKDSDILVPDSVSILVFVELALDGLAAGAVGVAAVGFQSLFSWNLLLMGESMALTTPRMACFNPCFRGTCS